MMRGYRLAFLILSVGSLPTTARAADSSTREHIWEFGGGLSSAKGANAFYDGRAPNNLGSSPYLYLGIAPCLYHGPVRFYLGLQERTHLYSDPTSGASYNFLATYPYAELGIWRFYAGGGITPLVWHTGANGLTRQSGTLAHFVQAGFIIPITPEISINLVASFEGASVPSGPEPGAASISSPTSITTYGLGFRFYFGGAPILGSSGGSGGFHGYRYPMGFGR